jgi:hypothetical protein
MCLYFSDFQRRAQHLSLGDNVVSGAVFVLEEVGFITVKNDATIWNVLWEKVSEPHFGLICFAQPASAGVAIQSMDGNNANEMVIRIPTKAFRV